MKFSLVIFALESVMSYIKIREKLFINKLESINILTFLKLHNRSMFSSFSILRNRKLIIFTLDESLHVMSNSKILNL
jgi:hypothetical protein